MHTRKLALAAAVLSATCAHAQYGMEQMMNPMAMMNPAMMMAPMGMGMMNPVSMMSPMGGFGGPSPQQMLSNPYLNPMGVANPYLATPSPVQQMQGFFPALPAAPAYGAPAYGYQPQAAPAGTRNPYAGTQMFSAPVLPAVPAPK